MTKFELRVQKALNNTASTEAVRKATERLTGNAINAISQLENSDTYRDLAREAKMDVLRNLDDYLINFEKQLIGNGMIVHWAENGVEACDIIRSIARKHNVRNIVKSKSMVTEEIFLNESLINEGCNVVETDLGEYIIQLSDDRPSHMTAPIVHLSKKDIAGIMQRELDIPFTLDAKKLTGYARDKLRNTFIEADMGISGVNFGVVESGTLCIVTNEGNGSMVTSLPKVHVAVMGIEKLVPTLQDLDNFLKILARSTTSQKATSYTTLINGPKKYPQGRGPEEVHVVLLDNGRIDILGSTEAEILGCIRCGACQNICPVYRSIGGLAYGDTYAGPVGSITTPGLRGLSDWKELPHASSLCGACRDVCPVRLNIPVMLLSLRKKTVEQEHVPIGVRSAMKIFGHLIVRPVLYRTAVKFIRTLLNLIGHDGWLRSLPGFLSGWTESRDFRVPAKRSFQELWKDKSTSYD
jgi:L-lactate dehydrogenase complex protein LldF